jgi:preprotein translocase subunit SecG
MSLFLTVVHVIVCLFLIVVVLLQRGKGADIGAVFGGGSGATLFGSRGAGNFLTRLTTGAAVVFMLTSLSLAYFAQERSSLLEDESAPAAGEPTSPFAEPGAGAPAPAATPEGAAPAGGGFEQVPAPEKAPAPAPEAPTAAPAPEAPPAKAPATP